MTLVRPSVSTLGVIFALALTWAPANGETRVLPVASGKPVPVGGGGPREPPARVTLSGASTPRVTVTPQVPGTAHIILAVEDNGTPTLTSYRRVLTIGAR